jgi:membrane-bound ClpP family serine protease
MDSFVWPILLLILGLFFIVLELFIPSTGLLALLAGVSIVAAIYMAFLYSMAFGLIILIFTAFCLPVFIVLAVKIWPHTPIGRKVVLNPSDSIASVDDAELQRRQQLLGKIGVAKSKMLPSGKIVIDGRVYDAISQGAAVDPGQTVRVVSVSGNRIVVMPISVYETGETKEPPLTNDQPNDFEIDAFREPLT